MKRKSNRRVSRIYVVLLIPAIILLLILAYQPIAAFTAPEAQIVVPAGSALDWETVYPFSAGSIGSPLVPEPDVSASTAGTIADRTLSRYRREAMLSKHAANGIAFGSLMLSDGTRRRVWRYALDGAIIDVDAETGTPLLLADGVYDPATGANCPIDGCRPDFCETPGGAPGNFKRCLAETVPDFGPLLFPVTVIYLLIIGIFALYRSLPLGRTDAQEPPDLYPAVGDG